MCTTSFSTLKLFDGGVHLYKGLHCNSWQCDECAERNRRKLIARAQAGRPDWLLTLTSRITKGGDPYDAAQALVKAWRNVRRQLRRWKLTGKLEFLAIFEAGKQGWPHLHILIRGDKPDKAAVAGLLYKYTGAWIIDIRQVSSQHGVALYVSKYVAKGPARFGTLRSFWCSKNYAPKFVREAKVKIGVEIQRVNVRHSYELSRQLYDFQCWIDSAMYIAWVDHAGARRMNL